MKNNKIYIINSKKEKELFSFDKVYQSARRAGADKDLAKEIAVSIQQEIFPNAKTSDIYRKIKKILRVKDYKTNLKFSLKQAINKLGPTGFPFEKYVAEIFRNNGFEVKINQYISGLCLPSYEIDFVAKKENLIYIGECKFRNVAGDRVHTKNVLANFARFLDIYNGKFFSDDEKKNFEIKTIMVTNTKFTNIAQKYSECVGAELLGWRYPKQNSLEHLIEKQKLYPITILPSLNKSLKHIFVSEKIILARDVLKINAKNFAKKYKISENKISALTKQAKILLNS
ncbi:MAG: hypothetical protein U9Q27_01015 [Patescibacteria group bacterium]|nr:hypothetical protein [Patescibacteria group bacterium]